MRLVFVPPTLSPCGGDAHSSVDGGYVCVCTLCCVQLRKRKLKGVDPLVEGRDMDDWMVVDAGNIIVNIMDAGRWGGD